MDKFITMTSLKRLYHMISAGQPIPVKTIDGTLFPHILVQPDFNNAEDLKKYDSIIDWSQSLFKKIPEKSFDIKDFEIIKSSGRVHLTET
ncbi:MAG TPA: hypothetical protein VEC16_06130, partial [Alphaproteobacteria bacterium]|nr:hypothetical protein [Alphaproteobacteria bacterium]